MLNWLFGISKSLYTYVALLEKPFKKSFLKIICVDGDSWSQEYCWARGEIH